MTRYVFRPDADERPYGEKMATIEDAIAEGWYGRTGKGDGVQIVSDIEPFRSPVDRTWITSRSELRAHERRHGVRQIGNDRVGDWRPSE